MKLCGGGQWRLSKMFSLYIKKSDAPRFTISNLPANNKFKHTHTVKYCGVLQWLCLEAGQSITELGLLSLARCCCFCYRYCYWARYWCPSCGRHQMALRCPVKLTKPSWVRTKTVCWVENGHVWPFAPLPSAPPAFCFLDGCPHNPQTSDPSPLVLILQSQIFSTPVFAGLV